MLLYCGAKLASNMGLPDFYPRRAVHARQPDVASGELAPPRGYGVHGHFRPGAPGEPSNYRRQKELLDVLLKIQWQGNLQLLMSSEKR
jgi:hypothetical protein